MFSHIGQLSYQGRQNSRFHKADGLGMALVKIANEFFEPPRVLRVELLLVHFVLEFCEGIAFGFIQRPHQKINRFPSWRCFALPKLRLKSLYIIMEPRAQPGDVRDIKRQVVVVLKRISECSYTHQTMLKAVDSFL